MASADVRCCIVGGGPAGLMLGLLLARAGVEVAVLEKHADFLRDFRGDTIHPSTLDGLDDLGLLDRFLELPHEKVETFSAFVEDRRFQVADFRRLRTAHRFIAFMPQWDFLDFLAEEAGRHANFRLMRDTAAVDLIEESGRTVGVRARSGDGEIEIRADLVVGCDGRHSAVRAKAGLKVESLGAPIDVMWFRLPRRPDDEVATGGRFSRHGLLVTINRGDHWQCALVIPKNGADQIRAQGLDAFRERIGRLAPFMGARTGELESWDDVKALSVAVDRLTRWHAPGLLCIGDAAHAMSPIGGVGINLAIQDAVAAANILSPLLKARSVTDGDLAGVQRRRMLAVRVIQRMQLVMQDRVVAPVLASGKPIAPPLALRLLDLFPPLQWLPARVIGVGVRPERARAVA